MLFVSYTFSVTEALASPVVSAEHETLEGSYVIRESTFLLNPDNPATVDGIEFIVDGIKEIGGLQVKVNSDGAWYGCEIFHSEGQIKASCDTSGQLKLRVEDMDRFQIAAAN